MDTAIDYSIETWESLQSRLSELRLAVYEAWKQHGPGTTRQIAAKANMDILTFRPRTTELLQLGFITVWHGAGDQRGREGVYRAYSYQEALAHFTEQQRKALDPQLTLL
ncbi:hypothetical protein [Verrucomicrobium spinosum]|uniref:hypothetical protein n=1 Tax=Verrucomicrobium spinosum TaxID=2736 RepID=UPI00017463E7|nr:hypothetical protein [Verrucomicrobium spinosum]